MSSPPLTGNFFLECSDTSGNPYFTGEFDVNVRTSDIYDGLIKACPWLRENMSVEEGDTYDYRVDGVDFIFKLTGIKGPLN